MLQWRKCQYAAELPTWSTVFLSVCINIRYVQYGVPLMNLWALAKLPKSSEYNCFLAYSLSLAKAMLLRHILKAWVPMTKYATFSDKI